MGIETTLADLKGKQVSELPTVTNTVENSNSTNSIASGNNNSNNNKAKKNRRRTKKTNPLSASAADSGMGNCGKQPVQKLYDTCKDVYDFGGTGIVPSPDKIERLRAVLDDIKPVDVGLTRQMPYFRRVAAGQNPPITYLHLHECDKFSMGIFCLPPSGVIPLHNHPGMTVFSKLLFGTMHIKSYDWVVDAPWDQTAQHPEVRLAKVKVDSDFTAPCSPSILYPADGGNMHCFTAVTACAVLDVLGPPYSDADGRHCTYYLDFPYAKFSVDGVSVPQDEKEGYAWLQEAEKPDDLVVNGANYRGPQIVKK